VAIAFPGTNRLVTTDYDSHGRPRNHPAQIQVGTLLTQANRYDPPESDLNCDGAPTSVPDNHENM
jgi:hypothetical protein